LFVRFERDETKASGAAGLSRFDFTSCAFARPKSLLAERFRFVVARGDPISGDITRVLSPAALESVWKSRAKRALQRTK
jgi:hypothetical protein